MIQCITATIILLFPNWAFENESASKQSETALLFYGFSIGIVRFLFLEKSEDHYVLRMFMKLTQGCGMVLTRPVFHFFIISSVT